MKAVGIRAIDVVKPDGILRDDLQCALPCLKQFRVDLIAQRRDQSVDPRLQFFHDELLWWRLRVRVNLDLVSAVSQMDVGNSVVSERKKTQQCTPTEEGAAFRAEQPRGLPQEASACIGKL